MKSRMISACVPAVLLTVLLALVYPVSLHGQGIRQSVGIVKEKKDQTVKDDGETAKPVLPAVKPEEQITDRYRNDTVYSTRTRKQYGWFAPLDTISKECMLHQNASFRFTHRYPSGHWGKLETIDNQGNLVAGYMSPYILKTASADSDSKASADWAAKLKTSCVYEFIADPSGKEIIQERAYDKWGNLVYVYSRVPSGNKEKKRQYIGSYKDCYGLPAEMRKDSLFTYGTLVRLTEDRWGNDSIVEYIDAKGKLKPNSENVAMEVFICDRYGRMLKQQSRDEHGNLTIDNWGNCGNEYVWSDDHEVISATHMDDNWQPMRMPSRRGIENSMGVIKVVYAYDSWRRQVQEAYYTADDVPDCNLYGIHRITLEYDDRGRVLKVANFDIDGKLAEDAFGAAVTEYTYDNAGRNTGMIFLDKDRAPRANSGYMSRILYTYNDEGDLIQEKRYVVYDGKEKLDYEYREGKNYRYTRWSNNVVGVDSLDAEGRLVKQVYTDWNGNLSDDAFGYAVNEITYVPRPYGYDITSCYYDRNRKFCNSKNGWAINEVKSDTISLRNTIHLYDKEKRLIATYAEIYDKNGLFTGEDDTNVFGTTCRAGGVMSVRHYRALMGYSCTGSSSTLIGRDEFGEPDYISSPWGIYYYMKLSAKGNNQSMDENSQIITDQVKFKNECPKVMSIEVTDSIAYRLGLRDNDVILVDGDYAVDVFAPDSVQVSLEEFVKDWTIHSVLDGSRNRRMVVFRVNPETLEYGLVEINGLKGSPSELGYLAHIRYLTRKQLRRIQASVKENMESASPLVGRSDLVRKDYSGDNLVIVTFTDMYRNVRHNLYSRKVTDPSILLGACMKEGNMTWKFGDTSSDAFRRILNTRTMTVLNSPVQHFYLTRNGKDVIDLEDGGQALQLGGWWDVKVSDRVYRKLAALAGKAEAMLEREMTDVPRLDKENLADNWVLKLSGSGYEPYVQVSLLKDGTMKGFIEQYDSIEYNEGNALFRIRQNLDGRWADCGNMLEFTYQNENPVSLECIGLSGIDPLRETRSLAFVNKNAGENPQYYLNRMNVRILGRFAYVKDLSKDRLVIDDGTADGLTLYRLSRRRLKDSSGKEGQQESVADTGYNEVVELNEDSKKLLGTWLCRIDGAMNAVCTLHFTENGKVHLDIDVTHRQKTNEKISTILGMNIIIEGTWNLTGNFLKLRFDPAAIDVKFDADLEGVEGRQKEEMLAAIRQEAETEKQNMAMNLLWQFTSDGEVELENMTDTSFVLNGMEFTRADAPETGLEELAADKVVVVGRIEDPEGLLMKDGYRGEYIVLKWCGWNYTMTLEEFAAEFEKMKNEEKDIVLLPVEVWGKPNRYGKKILVLHYPPGMLGIRLLDFHVPYREYANDLKEAYDKYLSGSY